MNLNEDQFRPVQGPEELEEPEEAPTEDHRTREWAEQEYDASGGGLFWARGRK